MAKSQRQKRRFTHVEIENWKNFATVDVALQRRVFLVGPNASGKSNFLDVFRFLRDIVSVGGGFQEAVRKRGGVKSLRCLANTAPKDIGIRVQLGSEKEPAEWEYELRFHPNPRRPHLPILTKERVKANGTEILNRPDTADENDPDRRTQTALEQVSVNHAFRNLVEIFASIDDLHLIPQLVREPQRFQGNTDGRVGKDFLVRMAQTRKNTRDARLRRIQEGLRVAVPQLKELQFREDSHGIPHLRVTYEHWQTKDRWQTEEQFSDGTLRLIGFLWALLDGTGPLLLEEPELSLHPEVIRFIPQMLAKLQHQSNRQVLQSTHSPELLADEGIGLDEVLLFRPETNGTSVYPATDLTQIQALIKGGLSLAEAVIPHTAPKNARQFMRFGG
jgi:predicted ATPase